MLWIIGNFLEVTLMSYQFNNLFMCSSHWRLVDDPSVFVSPVNIFLSVMKVEQDRAPHTGQQSPPVPPIQVHPVNGFTVTEYQERLRSFKTKKANITHIPKMKLRFCVILLTNKPIHKQEYGQG